MGQPQDARATLQRVVKDLAGSPLASEAWFLLGEIAFHSDSTFDVDKRLDEALAAYGQAATDKHSSLYPFAAYMQGWCRMNGGEYAEALERFKTTVEASGDLTVRLDESVRKALRHEALEAYARWFSNVFEPETACREFLALGGLSDVQWMMKSAAKHCRYRNDAAAADIIDRAAASCGVPGRR